MKVFICVLAIIAAVRANGYGGGSAPSYGAPAQSYGGSGQSNGGS
ncbi:unnamed protein product, partial [Allacma fusca]